MVLIQFFPSPLLAPGETPSRLQLPPKQQGGRAAELPQPVSLQIQQQTGQGLQRVLIANDTQGPDSDKGPVCAAV